jgi:hypothetical protein
MTCDMIQYVTKTRKFGFRQIFNLEVIKVAGFSNHRLIVTLRLHSVGFPSIHSVLPYVSLFRDSRLFSGDTEDCVQRSDSSDVVDPIKTCTH